MSITFWQMYHQSILSLLVIFGGALIAYGRLSATMMSKAEFKKACDNNQDRCSMEVSKKLDKVNNSMRELKILVIDLHEKQSARIVAMDDKREDAKKSNHVEMIEITKALGRVEGQLGSIEQGRRSFDKN